MEWRRRGVSGIVASTNPTTKEVTITSRALMGAPQSVVIPITDKTKVLRYPPDSIPKYSDAKRSSFEEVKVGDQLRALGDKSTDGLRLTPEEVVFGTFKIAGGTVTAVDPATNTIAITDLQTKKPMTIVLKPDTVVPSLQRNDGCGPEVPRRRATAGRRRPPQDSLQRQVRDSVLQVQVRAARRPEAEDRAWLT